MTARTLLRSAVVLLTFAIVTGVVDMLACRLLPRAVLLANGALLVLACEAAMVATADIHHLRPKPGTYLAVLVAVGSAFALLLFGFGALIWVMDPFRWFGKTLSYASISVSSALAGASVAAASRRLARKTDRPIEVLMVVWAGIWFFLPWLGGWIEYEQLGTSRISGRAMLLLWHLPMSLLWAVRIVR